MTYCDYNEQIADVVDALASLGLDSCVTDVLNGCREDNLVTCMFRTSDLDRLRDLVLCLRHLPRIAIEPARIIRVQLFPCPKCHRWTVTEWYEYPPGNSRSDYKQEDVLVVESVEEACELYSHVLGKLRVSAYNSESGTYDDDGAECNLIVTGSHCTCAHCASRD